MFKIGDKVRIRENSIFHDSNSDDNPHNDVVGTITKTGVYTYGYEVEWPHGFTNSYGEEDLECGVDKVYTMSTHRFI